MKVFYSWQSDTPNNIGRAFIREALDEAIAGLDVDEADRPTVDQDTAGVLGSPPIADTIFQKIRASQVVVADVTLTGQTPEGKHLANSNVAIELGYALGVHGDAILLKVMNRHYGQPDKLPFDLAHRRWPVQFNLPPGASADDRRKARDALAKTLRGILEAYLAASRPPPEQFARAPSTYNAAAYWQPGEALAKDGRTGEPLVLHNAAQPLLYLRISPREKIAPLSSAVLNDYGKSSIEPFIGRSAGWSPTRNRHGTLTHTPIADGLFSITQVLKSGEIWGVDARLLREREGYPTFVPADACEAGLQESLRRYLQAGRDHFGYSGIIEVEAGLVNVIGFNLAIADRWGDNMRGPIYEDVKVATFVDLREPATSEAALLKIFSAIFDAAGLERPQNYRNFPGKS